MLVQVPQFAAQCEAREAHVSGVKGQALQRGGGEGSGPAAGGLALLPFICSS